MTQWHPGDELPSPVTKRDDKRWLATVDVEVLAQAVMLLNDKPRFGPRNRRLHFDSYSVAAALSNAIKRHGFNPTDPMLFTED